MTEQLGRYEILEKIGEGGFAIVHRGRDTTLDRLIALKELRPILLNNTDWIRRFRREARTIAQLDHPNIVTIHDIYETQGRLFIVMRLVDGVSLQELITSRSPLPWPETVGIIKAIAGGLSYAHNHGILHRDLKPANILMDSKRGPMLTDFGLAKLAGDSSTSITAGGGVVGTPHYIAPEVWEGSGTTKQSDIYALGCILCEILTGEKVFKGETPPAVMMAHFKPLVLPKLWPPGVPPGVAHILRKALAIDPSDRYGMASEIADELVKLRADTPIDSDPSFDEKRQAVRVALSSVTGPASEPAGLEVKLTEAADIAISVDKSDDQLSQEANRVAADRAKARSQDFQSEISREQSQATAPISEPQPSGLDQERYRLKRGCLIGAGVGVFILVLIIMGVGSICSVLGNTFNAAFFTPIEVGETIEENIRIPVPDSAQIPDLEIKFGGGDLSVAPGAESMLVEGKTVYNAAAFRPKVTVSRNKITLQPEKEVGLGDLTTEGLENAWDLKLGSGAMNLTLHAGAAQADIELGGLSIANLSITQGGSDFNLSFSTPNEIEMDSLKFSGGVSSAVLISLANAKADKIIFEGGAGDFELDFSGELQADVEVTIQGGLGTITIIVPEDVAAELQTDSGPLSNISATGAWQNVDGRYLVPGEGHTISIEAKIGLGTLRLRTS